MSPLRSIVGGFKSPLRSVVVGFMSSLRSVVDGFMSPLRNMVDRFWSPLRRIMDRFRSLFVAAAVALVLILLPTMGRRPRWWIGEHRRRLQHSTSN
jgi:branched-subunit amino acid ABC-type transport system permease component